MKVFVVLALAVFTGKIFFFPFKLPIKLSSILINNFYLFDPGCNANIMQLNQPNRQQMDMVKDAFWDYVNQAGAAVEESMRQMRTSELGSEMK